MTAMNTIGFIKLRLISGRLAHSKAPSPIKNLYMNQLVGAVIVKTNVTAKPNPIDASTFFEMAKNEHIPKKIGKKNIFYKNSFCN